MGQTQDDATKDEKETEEKGLGAWWLLLVGGPAAAIWIAAVLILYPRNKTPDPQPPPPATAPAAAAAEGRPQTR